MLTAFLPQGEPLWYRNLVSARAKRAWERRVGTTIKEVQDMGTPRYSEEFKAEAVRLFKAGNKPVAQLARKLGVAGETIRTWASRAETHLRQSANPS
ncbi:MAG: transposase [Kofleriaceae bacterium]|nr:transposase [Kofleriaceae bacterium]